MAVNLRRGNIKKGIQRLFVLFAYSACGRAYVPAACPLVTSKSEAGLNTSFSIPQNEGIFYLN